MKKFLLFISLSLYTCITFGSVTFNVKVPSGTSRCYICGAHTSLGAWSASDAVAMVKVSGEDRFTLTLSDITLTDVAKGFKYMCSQDWTYVEKTSSGGEVSNRTTAGNPDTVEKWAAVPPVSYPNVFDESIYISGKKYSFQVMVPENYDKNTDNYPVLYMAGFKQRYKEAGSNDEIADSHFASASWNLPKYAGDCEASGAKIGIIVSFYAYLTSLTPYSNEYFASTGQADSFINNLVNYIMPAVNAKYRTKQGADNTFIGGASYAGLFAIYTAITHSDIFGGCLAFSPSIWVNKDDLNSLVDSKTLTGKYCLTYTTSDVDIQKLDVNNIAAKLEDKGATVKIYSSAGWHNDTSWGAQFSEPYKWINGNESSLKTSGSIATPIIKQPSKLGDASTVYCFMTGSTAAGVVCDNSKQTVTGNYYKDGTTPTAASMGIIEVPVDKKASTLYWNLNSGTSCTGTKLLSDDKACKVTFKNTRATVSWLRTAVFADNSVKTNSASKDHFKAMVLGKSEVLMSHTSTKYELKANVTFAEDKSVSIHYGSVNSGSDMGEIANASVSDDCTAATVLFNYLTNKVTVTETSWGSKEPKIESFQAYPAITRVGETITAKIRYADTAGAKSFSYRASYNYGTSSAVSYTQDADGYHVITINDAKSGIYHIDADYVNSDGEAVQSLSYICVKVMDGSFNPYTYVTANAYQDVDWSTIGSYKANFHTHTTQSNDAKFSTAETIDRYHEAGYKILAITDHDYNSFPWELLGQFKEGVPSRYPDELGMLAVPGIELSKDDRNNWNERGGGSFNHHNDFYTGRHGQEFQTIEESFAYTQSLGGYIIVNHPGQYWSIENTYKDTDRDSPAWHAKHFKDYSCLIGLEVYNQGNRRPNDRILWDQILTRTMPERPVWGYSCDDMHNADQLFRNYQFMLMDQFDKDGLIEAFKRGSNVFSYEPAGSGDAKAPRVNSITVDEESKTITIDCNSDDVTWISGTDIKSGAAAKTRKSSEVGRGKTFNYDGFQGSYVRAIIKNSYGETCIQPFGFSGTITSVDENNSDEIKTSAITLYPNPTTGNINVYVGEDNGLGEQLSVIDASGKVLGTTDIKSSTVETNISELSQGVYFVKIADVTTRVIKL